MCADSTNRILQTLLKTVAGKNFHSFRQKCRPANKLHGLHNDYTNPDY